MRSFLNNIGNEVARVLCMFHSIYNKNAARPSRPAATTPTLATLTAAPPGDGLYGVGVGELGLEDELVEPVLLDDVLLLTSTKLAQFRRVVLLVWTTTDSPTKLALSPGTSETYGSRKLLRIEGQCSSIEKTWMAFARNTNQGKLT